MVVSFACDEGIKDVIFGRRFKNCFCCSFGVGRSTTGCIKYLNWSISKASRFSSGEDIEVAELKKAYCSWLEISGKIETIDLSPQTLYEIVFVIKIEDPSVWDFMVRLVIVTPSKKWLSRYENLKGKPSNEWFEILVGEYRTSPGDVGLVELRMEEYTSKLSKRGISVQCAIIRPK
uniref:Phloem protein 2 n=1 Tax=Quercus lobata TaxID=97700 RepID=A0A7N2L547_QUELO